MKRGPDVRSSRYIRLCILFEERTSDDVPFVLRPRNFKIKF